MGGANNMPIGGGNNGFFGGNAPSSGNVGGGKGTSSSQSSYLPQGNTQMGGYANSLQQPSYGVPPSSYYQFPSQSNAQQRQMPQQIQPGTGQQDQSTAMQSAYNASQNAQGQGLGQGQATYNASQNVYGQANPQTATTMNQQQNPQQKVDAFIKEAGAAGKTFSPEEQKSMLENATKSFENEQAFRKNSPPQQSYGGMSSSKGTSQPAYRGGYSNPGSYGNTGASQALQSPQMVMPQAQAQIPAPVTNNPSNMGHSKGINPNSFKGTNVPFFAKGGEVNGQRSGVAVKDLTHEDVERIIRALRLAHFVVKEPKE